LFWLEVHNFNLLTVVLQERWDDLSAAQLNSEIIRVQNTIFAQLTAIAFNMSECGLDPAQISEFVIRMCEQNQLSDDQV
jgi:hypothetical protein